MDRCVNGAVEEWMDGRESRRREGRRRMNGQSEAWVTGKGDAPGDT